MTGSAWDIVQSFAPRDQGSELGLGGSVDSRCNSDKEEENDVEDGDAAVEGELKELRIGETFEGFTGTSSLSTTNDDDASSTTTEAMFIISPNGKFKRNIKSWMRGALLGSGSFGMVYEGISDEGAFFAVKEVSLLDQGSNAQQSIVALEQEIALLSQFEHENIVQYYGTDKEESKLYIFIELVTQGSLSSLYQKYKLRESQVSAYTRQILNGLVYLHERNVVHRDIKCANILVHANGSVKLADFGLAKEMSKINMLRSCKGSVYWMAPEVINPKKMYGPSADIWSLGCTVLEMLTRQIPFPNVEWTNAFFMIGRGEQPTIPNYLSKEAQDFIGQCVRVDPESRPSASQLLEHPFVNRPLRASFESSSPPAI
ncbi:Mitogen-activated protein kinase kinase kinase 1 [Zea mays]|nr:Mitogen-activated protein kinase kinase kinase 1 [Zea mays]ONM08292.1 Mitogen-activated protein kinase kinase kinase 1 [Zea mays]ONM08294.1 Mitogen-activated protein kinase kinase kinase 1 [Zea mays]ONM08297.1 Mitogen-activated protein kinase kinase kinase 1 [Zea mays]